MANLIIVLFFTGWFIRTWNWPSVDWRSGVGLIVSLTTFVLLDAVANWHVVLRERRRDADRVVYQKVIESLPPDGVIAFVRRLGHNGGLKSGTMDEAHEFVQRWENDPTRKFMDLVLEQRRTSVRATLSTYSDYLGGNVWDWSPGSDAMGVPHEWKETSPERRKDVIDTLDDLARKAVAEYDSLVLEARRRLAV